MRAGRQLASVLRAAPPHRRFDAACLAAQAVRPLLRRLAIYRNRPIELDRLDEVALYGVLELLERQQIPFTPAFHFRGAEHLPDALAGGRGVLVLGTHQRLNTLVPRYLCDLGHRPAVVAAASSFPIFGTGRRLPALQQSAMLLVRIRSLLRQGGIVCAMVDVGRPSTTFETALGQMSICESWTELAARCQAPVLLSSAHVDRGLVAVEFTPLSRLYEQYALSAEDAAQAVIRYIRELAIGRSA